MIKYPEGYKLIAESPEEVTFGFAIGGFGEKFSYLTIRKDNHINFQGVQTCTNIKNDPNIFADKLPKLGTPIKTKPPLLSIFLIFLNTNKGFSKCKIILPTH